MQAIEPGFFIGSISIEQDGKKKTNVLLHTNQNYTKLFDLYLHMHVQREVGLNLPALK